MLAAMLDMRLSPYSTPFATSAAPPLSPKRLVSAAAPTAITLPPPRRS